MCRRVNLIQMPKKRLEITTYFDTTAKANWMSEKQYLQRGCRKSFRKTFHIRSSDQTATCIIISSLLSACTVHNTEVDIVQSFMTMGLDERNLMKSSI